MDPAPNRPKLLKRQVCAETDPHPDPHITTTDCTCRQDTHNKTRKTSICIDKMEY
jgi:hypothetical protein